jgi:hypothetical protein
MKRQRYFFITIAVLFCTINSGSSMADTANSKIIPPLLHLLLINDNTKNEYHSQYLEEIKEPSYNASNPEHFLISSQEDWSHINDSDKRIFYVDPAADYGTITINSSGSAGSPRYLILHESSRQHPASLPRNKQANVHLVFQGAAHWIVVRLSSLDRPDNNGVTIHPLSHDIVLDRMHIANFGVAVLIEGSPDKNSTTENITVQRCRIGPMSPQGIDGDKVAIFLTGNPWNEPYYLYNTRILENEIFNSNDGIMLIRHPALNNHHPVDFAGTIIDANHIYINSDVYTDGHGHQDATGQYAWTENAIDLKGGSDDSDRPVIVSNNYMWGYRETDPNGGGSGSHGAALGGHYHVKNLEVYDNVIFSSNRSIVFADPSGLPYSVEQMRIYNNILYDIGYSPEGDEEYSHYFYDSLNVLYEHNTIVGGNSYWLSFGPDDVNTTIHCNVIVDSAQDLGTRSSSASVSNNFFYGTPIRQSGDGQDYGTAANAHLKNLTFITDRYTESPRKITLPGVLATPSSPHYGWCGQ